MDPSSGVVTLSRVIDYESLPEEATTVGQETARLHFTLFAFDSGTPQLSAAAQVNVDILNINDNDPVFSQVFLLELFLYLMYV